MTPEELSRVLWRAKDASDLVAETESIAAQLDGGPESIAHVRVIIHFIEEHPELEFGLPGPLVHWVEKFFGRGYEAELLASLGRQPRAHTVWMLNRVINRTKDPEVRARLIEALRGAGRVAVADSEVQRLVDRLVTKLT